MSLGQQERIHIEAEEGRNVRNSEPGGGKKKVQGKAPQVNPHEKWQGDVSEE